MGPFRFVHTSDIHLDTAFSASGLPARVGERKRSAIRAAFRSIVADARRESADFVLIAGDLFEHDRVTPDTVAFIRQQLESLNPVPVFISPGNHDPYIHGSPYRDERWPDNVHVFRSETFSSVELPGPGVRVTGFGFNRTHVPERLFARLGALAGDMANVVVGHGSDVSNVPPGKSRHCPFTIEDIAGKNVSYCALGHYHQQRPVPNPLDGCQLWYAGIPEGRSWEEEGSCGYLFCEADAGGTLRVQSRPTGCMPFKTLVIECDGISTREQILDAVLQQRGRLYDGDTLLRIRLEGTLDVRVDLALSEMEQRIGDAALHVSWDDRTLPSVDYEALGRERTLRGRFVRLFNEEIRKSSGEARLVLERARAYGVQALMRREVRVR